MSGSEKKKKRKSTQEVKPTAGDIVGSTGTTTVGDFVMTTVAKSPSQMTNKSVVVTTKTTSNTQPKKMNSTTTLVSDNKTTESTTETTTTTSLTTLNTHLLEETKKLLQTHVWVEAVHGEIGDDAHFDIGGWYCRKDLDFLNQHAHREVEVDYSGPGQHLKIQWSNVIVRLIEEPEDCFALSQIYGTSRSDISFLNTIFNAIVDQCDE